MKVKDGGTILQAAAADTRRRERLEALYGEHGSVLAEDVALFGITRFRWLPLSGDRTRYALSLGDAGYALITPARDDHDLWHIHRVTDQGLFAVSETPVSLTDAMRTAEKMARGVGAKALATAAAPWRKRQSPSDKQLALLGRLTQTDTAAARKLSAGQVSDLIDAAKVTRLLRRHRIVQREPA
jgi:hypothetical protein